MIAFQEGRPLEFDVRLCLVVVDKVGYGSIRTPDSREEEEKETRREKKQGHDKRSTSARK
jgi:hypothetical protein